MAIYLDRDSAAQGGAVARTVSRYNDLIEQLADQAKQPGFSIAAWDALSEVVETEGFQRFGCFMEVQNWADYVAMLHGWATTTPFSSQFRRMTEAGNLAFLELQEKNGDVIVNSLSLYEVNTEGKICRLHIYLQHVIGR
jgi:hypothetical protein